MPALKLSRSITIDAPKEKVSKILSDFHTWPKWSPWLISEPTAKVDVETDGKAYTWEGKRVGSGAMKIENETDEGIYCDLVFLKPWKSKAKTHFTLNESAGKTTVTWFMDSSLPFFMFFMKKSMEAYIGGDYDRGLKLLKDYVEDGEAHCKIEWVGEQAFEGGSYVGIVRECTCDNISEVMPKDYEKLASLVGSVEGADMAKSFSQYHKFDLPKNKAKYTVGMFLDKVPDSLDAGFIKGSIPQTKIYTLKHTGPYDHIANAWSTMQSMIQSKEIKPVKNIHPFETYGNSPKDTAENDLVTFLNFAVK